METKQFETANLTIQDNGIAIVEFNRPRQLNAINEQLIVDIPEAFKIAQENHDIKVVVLTGAGKGFSSGGDISTLAGMKNPIHAKDTYDASTGIVKAVYEMDKPVIAAVNGPVAGASLATMMACDMIIAADTARFGFTFMQVAFLPDSGTSYFLAQKVGYHKALEILWYGKILTAQEADDLGLVNKLVPTEECLPEAIRWAEKLAQQPMMSVEWDKKLMRAALKNDFYEQADMESMYQLLTWSSPDFMEGAMSFAEKRKPVFNQKTRWDLRK
ncbi:MAG: enoyl-CoA hydratase/isomerase family protein [Bacillota bacterium]|nr:enoyl-CoA hydratase/isomerase family protein [Bacillota bacterium]